MQYLLRFDVRQPPDMTHAELFDNWYAEAVAALAAKQEGIIAGIWKVAGSRTIYAICEADGNYEVDALIESLPIMHKMGGSLTVVATPVYPYEQWAAEMKGMVEQHKAD